jgi:glycosyltransferase involved in cell wall biosynthesis
VARHHCERATGRVGEILAAEAVDLVHVEGFYLMQHVPDWVDVPVLLVEPNVEYELERQQVAASAGPLPNRRAFGAWARTRETEMQCWARAGLIGAMSAEDRETIRASRPKADVRLMSNGADHVPHLRALGSISAPERPSSPLLTLAADFASRPDVDAAVHFCQEILPLIRAVVPNIQLWLVGEDPTGEIRALGSDNVRVTGDVPDVVPYLDAADVVVCPYRIGVAVSASAGDALRRGKATVSTSIGAQGLVPDARAALAIADGSEAFAAAVTSLLEDRRRRAELERAASSVATLLPRWDDAAGALASVYEELLTFRSVVDRSAADQAGAGLSA